MRSDYRSSHIIRRPQIYDAPEIKTTKYDDSGQIFTEITCRGGPMTAEWVWKTKGSSREARKFRSRGPGCSSLINMVVRSVLYNSYNITAESLEGLPWELGSMLWQRLIASQLDSVKVWKAFACAYPQEFDRTLKRKHHIIFEPNMKLNQYIQPITSSSMDWIASLTLTNITCSRADLLQISKLINIGTLTIGPNVKAPDIGLDDSIIKSWGRLAAESEAFSVLRVLSCRSQKEITSRIFSYLHQFPYLALLNAEESNLGPQDKELALCHGWRYKTGVELSDWLVKGGTTGASWDAVVHACFRLGGQFCTEALTEEGVRAIDNLPVLHLSLGPVLRDASVAETGNRRLRCFHRMKRDNPQDPESVHASHKRSREEVQPHISRKKPTMRASKQQDMEVLLMGFRG